MPFYCSIFTHVSLTIIITCNNYKIGQHWTLVLVSPVMVYWGELHQQHVTIMTVDASFVKSTHMFWSHVVEICWLLSTPCIPHTKYSLLQVVVLYCCKSSSFCTDTSCCANFWASWLVLEQHTGSPGRTAILSRIQNRLKGLPSSITKKKENWCWAFVEVCLIIVDDQIMLNLMDLPLWMKARGVLYLGMQS